MLLHGDCLEQLKLLPDNSVDSLVTDPPAGISFMGKEWDHHKGGRLEWIGWLTLVMAECKRVMKPGAHGLVWALPRTSHWTATALEEAGFEIRDRVQHIFGSGFPKSLDVSKAIDKAAGAERKVIGKNPNGRVTQESPGQYVTHAYNPITAPSTDDAKRWQGFGTALKPASEDWWLIRKPCSEKTVAANALKWGTGALNIDGCRIEAEARRVKDASNADAKQTTGAFKPWDGTYRVDTQGRFPSHLILDEEAGALLDEQSGTLQKRGNKGPSVGKSPGIFGLDNTPSGTEYNYDDGSVSGASRFFYCAKVSASERNAGLDRYESIEVSIGPWESADLKAQLQVDTALSPPRVIAASGTLASSATEWNTFLFGSAPTAQSKAPSRSTTGTATSSTIDSPTLSWLLHSNTSASTLDANCVAVSGGSLARHAAQLSASKSSTSAKTVTAISAKPARSSDQLQIRSVGALKSSHPTVKPQKLMRYLCRMITPPGGTVLDPFMGSGSTGLAALTEGFQFIGIEREAEYLEIAQKRVEAAHANL